MKLKLVLLLAFIALATPLRADDIADGRAKLDAKYAADLAELATWCDQHQLTDAARQTRAWLPKRDPRLIYVFALPDALVAPANSTDPNAAEWWARFVKLRRAQADALFELAGKALEAHRPALAFELIRETVREFPDHERGRLALGYQKHDGRWVSAYAAGRLARGETFDERFGWLSAADLPRYEHGERKLHGQWISGEEDARRHADIQRGWRIDTEHFSVTTNSSLEAGVGLARQLEQLNEIWEQVFVTFHLSEAELTRRYRGTAPPRSDAKPHQVVYFRNRDEYTAALKPAQPMIGATLGFYWFDNHTTYFFAGADQNSGTLWHEATHQLFQETRPATRDLGRHDNFWVVEAVACYMESLTPHDGYWTLGGAETGRLPAARKRLLGDNFYVPLAELVALGRTDFQSDPRLPRLYSQSSGLATFLMHFDGGRYRQPLIDYLRAVYENRADAGTLAKVAGASYDQLDRQYREWMRRYTRND